MSVSRRSFTFLSAALALLLMVACRVPAGDPTPASPSLIDSPLFRGDPTHTGNYPASGFRTTPAVLWQFETGGVVRSSPAVADGAVYIGSQDHYLYAIDALTGEERWRFETGHQVYSSPALAGGRVIFGSDDGTVYALNEVTGAEQWHYETGGPLYASAAVADGVVYVAGEAGGYLFALDAATGAELWRFKCGVEGNNRSSSPVPTGDILMVGSNDHAVYAFGQGP